MTGWGGGDGRGSDVGGAGGGGASSVEVTWRYISTSTIQSFAVLSRVIFLMLGKSDASCAV